MVRHRTTRLIRESIRLQESNILTEYDIVVVARKATKDKKYQDIESAFLNLCKRHNILKR